MALSEHTKIYLAARYNGGRADTRSLNPNQQAAAAEDYPYHLESYHYVGKGNCDDAIRYNGHKIFMDSGAFSMFTLGIDVNLEAYARFLTSRSDYIEFASNVDAIGAGREGDSYKNQKLLEDMGLKVPVHPVHHARDHDSWLCRYLDEGYGYIFLGGMVPETTGYLIDWLDHIWDKYLALPDGSPRVKIHGFGLTTFELMERYPWFSLDSTSWVQKSMFGMIFIDIGGKPKSLFISKQSPTTKIFDKSYWSLDSFTQDELRKRIEAEGFTVEELATMYGKRDAWNIRYYRRYMEKLTHGFTRSTVSFFD